MKRWIPVVVMAVLFAGAAFSIADAQGPSTSFRAERAGHGPFGVAQGRPFGVAQGRMGPGQRGFGGPMALGRIADLTDEQRTQIKAILDETRQSRQGPPAGMDLHRQLRAELLADAPDDQKIESLRQQMAQTAAESLAREIAVQRRIAQVLTAEQRAAARERLAQGRGRR
jgi:Spy/CpxP family protein refolding chaperone